MPVPALKMRHIVGVALLLSVVFQKAMLNSNHIPEQSLSCEDTEQGSFLWTLSSRSPPVHFFGTIHVPYSLVWGHVPWTAKRSFERADAVFFELDLTDPQTVADLATCQMLPLGTSLSDILPDDLYKRLKRHLDYVKLMIPSWTKDEHRGLYSEYLFKAITGNWERKRPVWVMLMVSSLTESDIRATGIPVLDLYLAREAARMGKRAGAVERAEEQCLPLNGLNGPQVLFALNQTLVRLERLRAGRSSPFYGTEDLIRHYNCQNLTFAAFSASSEMVSENEASNDEILLSQDINRYFRQELIEKRNARMADRVLQLIKQFPDESFFFAFGAGHFLGNGSVLDYVKDGGYDVIRVAADAKIRSYRRPHHHPRPRQGARGAWEPRRNSTKRKGAPHGGVQLLRAVSTPSSANRRHFNDLWVKMDQQDRSIDEHYTSRNSQQGSRAPYPSWGSHPSNSANLLHVLTLFWVSCIVHIINRVLLVT